MKAATSLAPSSWQIRWTWGGVFLWLGIATATCSSPGRSGAQAVASSKADAAAVLREALALRASHQPEQAKAALQALLQREPEHPEALVLLAEIDLDAGDRDEAQRVLGRALTASPNSPAANLAMGSLLLRKQDDLGALNCFERVLATNLHDQGARRGEVAAATALALQQARADQPGNALDVLSHAAKLLPDEPELQLDLGIEATALKQFPLADQALHRALALKPGDAKEVYALARLEVEEQHLPDAERDLEAYLVLRPEDASAYFGLGHVYAMEQRNEEARKAFEQSITVRPEQTESYYQLGQMALEAQQDATAQQMFTKVLERAPHHAGALTGLGQLALRDKQYAQAEQYLAAAEQSDPAYATPHYFRGLALAKLGRKDEAAEEMRKGDSRPHATSPSAETPAGSPASAAGKQPPGT